MRRWTRWGAVSRHEEFSRRELAHFNHPDCNDGFNVVQLRQTFQMDPQSSQDKGDQSDVKMPESFVEGMAKGSVAR